MKTKIAKQLDQYILEDYLYLQDYEITDNINSNNNHFLARIKDTSQKVRFIKQPFDSSQIERFKSLHRLFKNGIILADNIFILEECGEYYYYVIEAEVEISNQRFRTLQDLIYDGELQMEDKRRLINKIKILLDCIHQQGQAYAGLSTKRIVIDEEQNIFLMPFDLTFEFKSNHFKCAYYSPQVLQMIHSQKIEVSQDILLKMDVWAFGCICLQILAYSSPYFLESSIQRQISRIKSTKYEELLNEEGIDDSFKNIVMNSLSIDIKERCISIHNQRKKKSLPFFNIKAPTKSDSKPLRKAQSHISQLRQLNLTPPTEGNSQLTLSLLSLTNLTFSHELDISIYLNKKYHFYIDNQTQSKNYNINRKITLKGEFQQFSQLLMNSVEIELREGDRMSRIKVNLQTLVILYQGRRIWEKNLLGSYEAADGEFIGAKLKLSCQLKSPSHFIEEPNNYEKQTPSIKQKFQSQPQPLPSPSKPLSQLSSNSIHQKPQKYTSISEITKTLNSLTQHWKRKNQQPQQKDENKLKIESILQID